MSSPFVSLLRTLVRNFENVFFGRNREIRNFSEFQFYFYIDSLVQSNYTSSLKFVVKYWFLRAVAFPVFTHFRAKSSSPKEKYLISARRQISSNTSKSVYSWSKSEPKRVTSHLDKLWLSCLAKLYGAKFSSGEIIHPPKFSSLFKKFVTFSRLSFSR